jgi:two-component system, OmpR family, heavy metal sensor histidine kinase CusS
LRPSGQLVGKLSLASRVTAFIGVTFIFCVVSLGFAMQRSIIGHFAEQDAEEYAVMVSAIENAIAIDPMVLTGEEFTARMEGAISGHHGVFFGIFDTKGEALYMVDGPDLRKIVNSSKPVHSATPDNLYQWSEDDSNYRGVVVLSEEAPPGTKIAVASDLEFHLHFIDEFQLDLWKMLASGCGIILLAAWAAVRLGHRPLHRISEQISSITAEQLGKRLDPATVPNDLVDLVISFNEMIERMEDVFLRLSHVSADIAHELRTPITNLTTQTQVALSQARESDEYREILYSNLEEFERMAKMINEMLWLARTDSGLVTPAFEKIDPVAEIQSLFEYMDAWAEERGLTLRIEGGCPSVNGDRSMFRRAFSNLLTNAIHHADHGSEILVTLGQANEQVEIVIQNKGEEIPPADLSKVFERFHRADPSRQRFGAGASSGTGLGLSIVESIISAHSGSISVSSTNNLTSFEVHLPLSTAED